MSEADDLYPVDIDEKHHQTHNKGSTTAWAAKSMPPTSQMVIMLRIS
jgi:hypothetical protein